MKITTEPKKIAPITIEFGSAEEVDAILAMTMLDLTIPKAVASDMRHQSDIEYNTRYAIVETFLNKLKKALENV